MPLGAIGDPIGLEDLEERAALARYSADMAWATVSKAYHEVDLQPGTDFEVVEDIPAITRDIATGSG